MNFFWKYLPSTMSWQCILSPQIIFNFQTVFLFTLKDDCNKNQKIFFPNQFWPLKIKISPIFILFFCTQNCKVLMFYFIDFGQKVDIYPSNLHQSQW